MRRVVEIWREGGPRLLFWKVLGETVFRRMRYFEQSVWDSIPPASPMSDVAFGELPPERWHELQQVRPGTSLEQITGRLHRDERCLVATAQGRIVHMCWIAAERAWCEILGVEIPLAQNAVYVHSIFTIPDMRRRGLATEASKFCLRWLRQAGFQSAVALVDADNLSGVRALEKSGYHASGWLAVLRLGSWRRLFLWKGSREPRDSRSSADSAYWSTVSTRFRSRDYRHVDPFVGWLKRRTHLRLISGWAAGLAKGRVLKTDLFEEAGGADALVPSLIRSGGRVVGMDVSPGIAARANARIQGQASLTAADVRRLPFASRSFDLVVSPSTLDHFHDTIDLSRSLREIHRVLQHDGRLIITLDNRQNILDWLLRAMSSLGLTPYYLGRSYTMAELRRELESADFEVLDFTGILHSPRLTAVAATAIAWRLRSRRLTRLVHRILLRAQRLEHTRWVYFTASFVCACARPRARPDQEPAGAANAAAEILTATPDPAAGHR
jgi:SAM-dependent methyltransferase